ncbi:Uncharacterised protein [Mycobacteroides abscessus subsp. abscessus]|uniref:hypothetical protein n=1 Tax=Mycobacteroides abscessus TaxID=36809 RepID=UPI000929611E|nr:hypothetical protein [Mycobacteroides abscessus]SIA42332.1 Uncharacterised protein [Mycobacteroides abscessus subsp. abscessus]SIA56747.1 Uncharacterised protein [Mycobacteroides abscessus subsp. abscessus]
MFGRKKQVANDPVGDLVSEVRLEVADALDGVLAQRGPQSGADPDRGWRGLPTPQERRDGMIAARIRGEAIPLIDQQKAESEYWQWRADNGNGPLAPNRP